MKKLISLFLTILLVFGNIQTAVAQELESPQTPATEQDPGKAVSPMFKGDRAPFTGLLLSPRTVAELVAEQDERLKIQQAESDRTLKLKEAECKLEQKISEADLKAAEKISEARLQYKEEQIKILSDRLKTMERNEQNVTFWVIGGFAVGAALTTLVVFGVQAAENQK